MIRGINVGRAKRAAMADLRTLFEDLGYGEVRTASNLRARVGESPEKDRVRDFGIVAAT